MSRILLRANGIADGVLYFDADGVERRQRAEIVMACNGVGTPPLPLHSACAREGRVCLPARPATPIMRSFSAQ